MDDEAAHDTKTEVQQYAASHPDTTEILPSGKLRFTLTGMEFPATASKDLLLSYATGRSMRRAQQAEENSKYDFDQHRPYIVPHRERNPKFFLFCLLTKTTVRKTPEAVKVHVAGKRFSRLVEIKRRERELFLKRREARKKWRNKGKEGGGNGENNEVGGDGEGKEKDENVDKMEEDGKEDDEGVVDVLDGIEITDDEGDDGEGGDEDGESNDAEKDGDDADSNYEEMTDERAKTSNPVTSNGHAVPKTTREANVSSGKAAIAAKVPEPSSDDDDDDEAMAAAKRLARRKGAAGKKRKRTEKPLKKVQRERRRRKSGPNMKTATS